MKWGTINYGDYIKILCRIFDGVRDGVAPFFTKALVVYVPISVMQLFLMFANEWVAITSPYSALGGWEYTSGQPFTWLP